jgi:hypothetical protein
VDSPLDRRSRNYSSIFRFAETPENALQRLPPRLLSARSPARGAGRGEGGGTAPSLAASIPASSREAALNSRVSQEGGGARIGAIGGAGGGGRMKSSAGVPA